MPLLLKLIIVFPRRLWNKMFFRRSNKDIYHFSYHKNLTVYYSRVAHRFAILTGRNFKHFNSELDKFKKYIGNYNISSLNNHYLENQDLPKGSRKSVFIRDPRDLVISGYYYHKKGSESWCMIKNPTESDFGIVNGIIPSRLKHGESLYDLYNRLSIEDGIRSEIEFRRNHFQTMESWIDNPEILILKYEDILYDEERKFELLAEQYQFNEREKKIWISLAKKLSISEIKQHKHVRNPKTNQFKTKFPTLVLEEFCTEYNTLLKKYKNYSSDKS